MRRGDSKRIERRIQVERDVFPETPLQREQHKSVNLNSGNVDPNEITECALFIYGAFDHELPRYSRILMFPNKIFFVN
jgi:hypothetical protein